MAEELVAMILESQRAGSVFRAILPCGPMAWVGPFKRIVNERQISLQNVVVFHMDECLDWEGREIKRNHPYSFRGVMEREFYSGIDEGLSVPVEQRRWLNPDTYKQISEELLTTPADLAYGGWGQDGHVAYNQARRDPFSEIGVDELRMSRARIQNNNVDTIIALAQRTFGGAYHFVPPMSVTLGVSEILGARKVRLFSDTGAWKQTALRVALFSEVTPDYPMTLLQTHPDALLTATVETADHPVALHPEWDLSR